MLLADGLLFVSARSAFIIIVLWVKLSRRPFFCFFSSSFAYCEKSLSGGWLSALSRSNCTFNPSCTQLRESFLFIIKRQLEACHHQLKLFSWTDSTDKLTFENPCRSWLFIQEKKKRQFSAAKSLLFTFLLVFFIEQQSSKNSSQIPRLPISISKWH